GGAVLLYEGAPDYPSPDRIWSIVERHRVSILGVSPTLVRALIPHGDANVTKHDRSSLRILASTGEPWNPDPWRWYFDVVGESRCPIINISGGTEVGACFLSPTPLTPLRPCTLGGPALGMAIDVYDPEGKPLPAGEVGELVCTKPWPGMTRGIWGDSDRYIETYWSRWPDVWVHGDWASRDADGYWYLHGRRRAQRRSCGARCARSRWVKIRVTFRAWRTLRPWRRSSRLCRQGAGGGRRKQASRTLNRTGTIHVSTRVDSDRFGIAPSRS